MKKILTNLKGHKTQFLLPKNVNYIWFFLYFLQLVYIIYSFIPSIKNSKYYIKAVGLMFSLICIINIGIVFTYAQNLQILSLIFDILMVLALAYAYYNLQHIQKTFVNLSTTVNYLCCELLFYAALAWVVIATFWQIFCVHKHFYGKLPCDCWIIFVFILLTVVYLFIAFWRHEPVKLWVLSGFFCVNAHYQRKVHKAVGTTACVCMWITFVVAVVITVYNLYMIIKDYVKSYKESKVILVKN